MWSPTTGANVVVVAAIVVVVDVVLGAIVVVVVVVEVVEVETAVGATVGAATAGLRASCHCDSTYAAAPPTTRAISTRSTMPTLRLDRAPWNSLRSWYGSGGSQRCDMFATVLRTTTPEPAHTPLVHSTYAHPPQRHAITWPAADVARWRGRGLAARPGGLRRESPGRGQLDLSSSTH